MRILSMVSRNSKCAFFPSEGQLCLLLQFLTRDRLLREASATNSQLELDQRRDAVCVQVAMICKDGALDGLTISLGKILRWRNGSLIQGVPELSVGPDFSVDYSFR